MLNLLFELLAISSISLILITYLNDLFIPNPDGFDEDQLH